VRMNLFYLPQILEEKLLEAVNATGIRSMGMDGKSTALTFQVEMCRTHSAAVPVVVAMDSHGKNIFDELQSRVDDSLTRIFTDLEIDPGHKYLWWP